MKIKLMPCETCPDAGICDGADFPACSGETGMEEEYFSPAEEGQLSAQADYYDEIARGDERC